MFVVWMKVKISSYFPTPFPSFSKSNRFFPGGTVDKNPPANAEDIGSIPVSGILHIL